MDDGRGQQGKGMRAAPPAGGVGRIATCLLYTSGCELGGGSIRIHDPALQTRMFEALGFTEERAKEQFGHLITAFSYGAPPHGGLAYGLDLSLIHIFFAVKHTGAARAFQNIARRLDGERVPLIKI